MPSQNVEVLSDFSCPNFFHFYVCYGSHFFTNVKLNVQGNFEVDLVFRLEIFHQRDIKSQNLSQDSTQNVEISTCEAVTFELI